MDGIAVLVQNRNDTERFDVLPWEVKTERPLESVRFSTRDTDCIGSACGWLDNMIGLFATRLGGLDKVKEEWQDSSCVAEPYKNMKAMLAAA